MHSKPQTGQVTSLTIAEAADDLRWIQMVTRLRATGMPIRDVRRYAALVREGAGNEASVAPTRWPRVDFERTPRSSLES